MLHYPAECDAKNEMIYVNSFEKSYFRHTFSHQTLNHQTTQTERESDWFITHRL